MTKDNIEAVISAMNVLKTMCYIDIAAATDPKIKEGITIAQGNIDIILNDAERALITAL